MFGRIQRGAQAMHHVAVWPVETLLLELLRNHAALHPQRLGVETQPQHTVALEVHHRLDVLRRHDVKEVGEVIGRPGVVLAPGILEFLVKRRYVDRAAEHQMLEQMRYAGEPARLVARPGIIEHVDSHHDCRRVVVVYHTQTVGQRVTPELYHLSTFIEIILTSSTGRSEASVSTFSILSITSMPSITSPNTV